MTAQAGERALTVPGASPFAEAFARQAIQADDRRAIIVCLTGRGRSHAREINAIMVEANNEFLGQLGSKQSQKFRALLKHVWMERS